MTTIYNTASAVDLIAGASAGDSVSENGLMKLLIPGTRLLIKRRVRPDDIEDAVQEVLLLTLEAIRQRRLREPLALPGYVRTIIIRVAGRITATYVQQRQQADAGDQIGVADTPEHLLLRKEQKELVLLVLDQLNAQQREIVERFYLLEQSKERICSDMRLTETQFRLAKSRAKQRLTVRAAGMTPAKSRSPESWQRIGCVA